MKLRIGYLGGWNMALLLGKMKKELLPSGMKKKFHGAMNKERLPGKMEQRTDAIM